MRIPFISGEGPDGYLPVNLYFTPKKIYGRDALVGRPGLLEFSDTGNGDSFRAWCEFNGDLFSLVGDKLIRTDINGNSDTMHQFPNSTGVAWMAANKTQLMIVANRASYIFSGGEVVETTGSFRPDSLAYCSGYFLSHKYNTGDFYESTLFDGTDWNELERAITEVSADNLVGLYNVNSEIFAIGKESGEIYYNSGGSDFAFSKVPGGNIPCGCPSPKSPAVFLGSLIMLNNHRVIVQATTQPLKLSNEHVDRSIGKMSVVNDAVGFIFTMNGHTFSVHTFPSEDQTFVLDVTNKFWYVWKTGNGRWRPNCYINFAGKHLVGDYKNGKIYELSQTTYTDDGDEIIRQRAMPVQKDENFYTFSQFEIDQEAGVGLSTGQGSNPQALLEISKDKGKTWSYEKWCDIGKAGKYNQRLLWRKLGRHRQFTPRVTVTDPVKTVWTGAYINGDR
jgi:hypothetical protein